MSSRSRELGGAPAPVLLIVVAAMIIGGAIYCFTTGDGPTGSQSPNKIGFKAAKKIDVEKPKIELNREIPRLTEDSEDILQGALIKYHDENGNVRFRSQKPVTGVDGAGNSLYAVADLMASPMPRVRASATEGARMGPEPPKLSMKGGRLKVLKKKKDR